MTNVLPKIDRNNLIDFLLDNITLLPEILTQFDTKSIMLLLAINRTMYRHINDCLFQINSLMAMRYQKAWLKRAIVCKEIKSSENASLATTRVQWWLSRKDITNEARFFGLLYSARCQDIHLKSEEGIQLFKNFLENGDENSISKLSIFSPYLLLYLLTDKEFIYEIRFEKIKDELFDFVLEKELTENSINIFNFFVHFDLLNFKQIDYLFEKVFNSVAMNMLGYQILISLVPGLESRKVQKVFDYLLSQFRSPDVEDVCREACTLLMVLLPKLELDQLRGLLHEIINITLNGEQELLEAVCDIVLPSLKREGIQSILPLILESLSQADESSQNACEMVRELSSQLQEDELKKVYERLIELLSCEDEICLIAADALQKLIMRLGSPEIFTFFYVLIRLLDQSQAAESYHWKASWNLLVTLVPRLQTEQIAILMTQLPFLLQNTSTKIEASGLAAALLPHLQPFEINPILPYILNCIERKNQHDFIHYYDALAAFLDYFKAEDKREVATSIVNMLFLKGEYITYLLKEDMVSKFLPYLESASLQKILAHLQTLLQEQNYYISDLAGRLLANMLSHLNQGQINTLFRLILALLNEGKVEMVFRTHAYLMDILWPKLQSDQKNELFIAIQKLIRSEGDLGTYSYKGIYTILLNNLSNLSETEILLALPDIQILGSDTLNASNAIALANFLNAIKFKIDFTKISPNYFLEKPILIFLKLLSYLSHKITEIKLINRAKSKHVFSRK